MTRILITGVGGQVGFELQRACQPLGEVVAVDQAQLDLSKPAEVRSFLHEVKPQIIVNPAAYTSVDKAELEEPLARAVNADAVALMAGYAKAAHALLVHYSTDYVFDGSKAAPYAERDQPAPLSAYGRTKLAGEQALAASGCDYLCLRTSWVYSSRGRNFLKTMLKLGQERDELRVVSDQIGAPTTARLLADITSTVLVIARSERERGEFRSELLHAVPDGWTTWHGFASAIFDLARAMGIGPMRTRRVEPISSAEYPAPAARPLNSRLDCARIRERFDVFLPDWQTGLKLCMQELT